MFMIKLFPDKFRNDCVTDC